MFGENFHRYQWLYFIAIACMIAIAAITAFNAWVMGPIVKNVFIGGETHTATILAIAVAVAFTIKGIMGYIQNVLLNKIGISLVAHYQKKLFHHLTTLRVEFFNARHSVELIAQLNQNINAIRNMMNTIILGYARDMLTVIALVGVMLWRDAILTLSILTVGPIILFIVSRYTRRVRSIARQEVNLNSQVITGLQEVAHGIEIVKSFTMEKQLNKKMQQLILEAQNRSYKIAKITARTSPLMEFMVGLAIAGTILYGAKLIAGGGYDTGTITSFLTAMLLAYEPAKRLTNLRVQLERTFVNTRMIYEILDTKPSNRYTNNESQSKKIKIAKGEIKFENVIFHYNDNQQKVLDGLSFTAPAGKTTALVGPSGGGKTTIIALLQRFYDPTQGAIKIDNENINNVSIHSLRENIAYVSQDAILFQGTIYENLLYANPKATKQQIIEAAKVAQAHEFICELPQGYETDLGENATNLSGGQRQRLAIARAIIRNAPILLLDEATSALDNESENKVQVALNDLMKNKTTIVIAHRLATIEKSDYIIAIKDGKVVDKGTHNELMQSGGLYAELQNINERR